MFYQCTIIYLLILRLVNCDRSFTLVLDTTWSMQDDIDVIKANLPSVLNTQEKTDIGNYIIVPFNDPGVGEPIIKATPQEILSSLNGLTAAGGTECPENSLTGIEKALQISKDQSNIFVFTDAYSKDAHKIGSIENLCENTRSKVIILLSGFCSSPNVDVQVYFDVAKACSGAVLKFDAFNLRQAFPYMKEAINVKWTDIITSETFVEYKQLTFTVDAFTKTSLVVASGENPTIEMRTPDDNSIAVEKIVNLRNTQVPKSVEILMDAHITLRGWVVPDYYRLTKLNTIPAIPRGLSQLSLGNFILAILRELYPG
ncbi:unnamed protein product [Chrysodeixis includens]|uniref:Hemicentin-1-like von Willebrand factor A domain-containing protein n=1 Tax=Chrysodeixis includens TaxID=689277 RepID=A0A9N8L678_CHRIL|nr:unnamed protein product [Chrysodeixis includens]